MYILKYVLKRFVLFVSLVIPAVFLRIHNGYSESEIDQSMRINAWVVYWDQENGAKSLQRFASNLDTLSLFNYAFDGEGRIIENEASLRKNTLMGNKAKVMATIVNDIIPKSGRPILKDPKKIHEILENPKMRGEHIQEIANLAEKNNFDGIDIDYENLQYEDRENFSVFIKELAARLHTEGRKLSVTVQQKVKEKTSQGAGAMDWAELGRHADEIRIMCYNFSSLVSKPGPLAPPAWVQEIITFAKAHIPEEKINIALGLQGFDWSKEKVQSITYDQAMKRAEEHQAEILWDNASSTPHFQYSIKGEKHEIWFENKASIKAKLELLEKNGIRLLSLWRLGQEDPANSELLEK
jgi:spore germination protein